MKLRWRILSKAQLEEGGSVVRGAVTVRRTEHYSEQCVLEWQDTEQTQKDFWTRVDVERPTVPQRGPVQVPTAGPLQVRTVATCQHDLLKSDVTVTVSWDADNNYMSGLCSVCRHVWHIPWLVPQKGTRT